eukprot:scaffold261371_cov33-Tisochrysis_lutea.AAC.5
MIYYGRTTTARPRVSRVTYSRRRREESAEELDGPAGSHSPSAAPRDGPNRSHCRPPVDRHGWEIPLDVESADSIRMLQPGPRRRRRRGGVGVARCSFWTATARVCMTAALVAWRYRFGEGQLHSGRTGGCDGGGRGGAELLH